MSLSGISLITCRSQPLTHSFVFFLSFSARVEMENKKMVKISSESGMCQKEERRQSLLEHMKAEIFVHQEDWKVQHLIEKCLIFNMSKEECMEALSKHANIKPVITSTVWNELEKENKEFFEAYSQTQKNKDRMSETETSAMIKNMISDHDNDHDQENPKDPEE